MKQFPVENFLLKVVALDIEIKFIRIAKQWLDLDYKPSGEPINRKTQQQPASLIKHEFEIYATLGLNSV